MNVAASTAASAAAKSVSSKDTKSNARGDDNEFASALKSAGDDSSETSRAQSGNRGDDQNAEATSTGDAGADNDVVAANRTGNNAGEEEVDTSTKDLDDFLRSLLGGDEDALEDVTNALAEEMAAEAGDADAKTASRSDIASQLASLMAQVTDKNADTRSNASSLLKKLADAANTDGTSKGSEDLDAVDVDQLGDMMSLLAMVSQQAQANATDATSAADAQATAGGKVPTAAILAAAGNALSGMNADGGDNGAMADDGTGNDALFRSLKSNVPATDADLKIAPGTAVDPTLTPDGDQGVGDDMTVQVIETRRFLGVAQDTNASSIAKTIANDADWSTTLEPATKLGNSLSTMDAGKLVQTLKIQLNPIELGTVDATLRLVGDDLTVHLTVTNGRAFHELSKDSSTILDALRQQGLTVDNVSVSLSTSSDKNADGSANARQGGDMAQQMQQQGERQAGNGGRQNGQGAQTPSMETTSGGSTETSVQTPSASGTGNTRPGHVYI